MTPETRSILRSSTALPWLLPALRLMDRRAGERPVGGVPLPAVDGHLAAHAAAAFVRQQQAETRNDPA